MATQSESKKNILIYSFLAILFTGTCWLVGQSIAEKNDYLLPTAANFFILADTGFDNNEHKNTSLLFQMGVYGPLLAAILITTKESGKAGLRDLVRRTLHWRVGGRWYLKVLLVTGALTLIPVGFGLLTGTEMETPLTSSAPWTLYILFFIRQMLTSGLGEEVGWRGYLLPKLQSRIKGDKAIWLTGLIWAVWHYAFVINLFVNNMEELSVGAMIPLILFSLAGFTMTIIGQTFIYAWLYNQTNSVFLAIFYHALGNTFLTVFGGESLAAGPMAIFPALMPWLIVIILQKKYGKESFLPKQI